MGKINLSNPLKEVMSQYEEQQFILIHNFVSVEFAQQLLRTTDGIPMREVICGDKNITFGEQHFTQEHPLFKLFMCQDVLTLVLQLMQADSVASLSCWTSVYGIGQYINAHKDRSGDLQIIVCLQASFEENGGQLCVALSDGERKFYLTPGDAVIFKASALQHYTTPLVATEQEASPKRVVVVGRYYL
jgi:hypothetical protein